MEIDQSIFGAFIRVMLLQRGCVVGTVLSGLCAAAMLCHPVTQRHCPLTECRLSADRVTSVRQGGGRERLSDGAGGQRRPAAVTAGPAAAAGRRSAARLGSTSWYVTGSGTVCVGCF